jgi:mannose-1-phosphate guanylyltransferase
VRKKRVLAWISDPILVITPADQTIQNAGAFTKALQQLYLK